GRSLHRTDMPCGDIGERSLIMCATSSHGIEPIARRPFAVTTRRESRSARSPNHTLWRSGGGIPISYFQRLIQPAAGSACTPTSPRCSTTSHECRASDRTGSTPPPVLALHALPAALLILVLVLVAAGR